VGYKYRVLGLVFCVVFRVVSQCVLQSRVLSCGCERKREKHRVIAIEIDTARRNLEEINEVDCLDCNPRVEDQ